MINPLENIPLNNKHVYVMGTTKTGCEVYIPVDTYDHTKQVDKRNELQEYLNNQNASLPLILA